MKVKILSDLHLDINKDFPIHLENQDVFTVICGDISEDIAEIDRWIKDNVKYGVFVEGNHVGYKSEETLQDILNHLSTAFPLNGNVSHLDNSYKIIGDIVFVGGILWSDFELYGIENRETATEKAKNDIKEFGCVRFGKGSGLRADERILSPKDAINLFNDTLKFIEGVCKRFPDKKIVAVTHHAPSLKSVPEMYKGSIDSAAFASNLDDFILAHRNIKLWCHGHIHQACDYNLGECRVICNPRGYLGLEKETGFVENLIIEI